MDNQLVPRSESRWRCSSWSASSPSSVLGIGVYGFANANAEHRLLGATLGVQLGNLR